MKWHIDGQQRYKSLSDVINALDNPKSVVADSIWVAKNYSIAALIRDLQEIDARVD